MAAPRLPAALSDVLPAPLFDRAVDLLVELTAISSPSGDLEGLQRMAARLGTELAARGLAVTTEEAIGEAGARLPLVIANGASGANGANGARGASGPGGGVPAGPLLLIGHPDPVLPPVPPRRAGDRLVATGASGL